MEPDFQGPPTAIARALVGARLTIAGCGGIIDETEAYQAEGDPACERFYRAKVREFAASRPAGSIHLHLTYGRYWMLNLLTKDSGVGVGFVLLRSLRPDTGLERMRERRPGAPDRLLCNGPGKLTDALAIDGGFHGQPLSGLAQVRLPERAPTVESGSRIGISRGLELPWRFFLGKDSAP